MIRAPILLSVLSASGCTTTPPAPPVGSAYSLVGEWRVVAINRRPSVGSATIRPPFLSFSFGCNDSRGGATIEDDRLVIIGPIGTTERGCVNADGSPSEAMKREEEGFRVAHRGGWIQFYGPDLARLTNQAGTIDLGRR